MAIVKKSVKKAEFGDNSKRCKIDKQGRRSCGPVGQGSSALSGRIPRMSKREEEESDRQMRASEILRRSGKSDKPASTAPGVRSNKKGSESFFGGEKDINDAKYGRKIKASAKKAKVGIKVKSIKKSIKKK